MGSRIARFLGKREPQVSTKLTQYGGRGIPIIPTWDAEAAYRFGYIANAFVFAAVRAIATDLSGLPFRTANELPEDPTDPHDYDINTPLAKLLGPPPGGPSPSMSARRLWAWSIAQRLITGRLAWEIEAAGPKSPPLALWPLLSRNLYPIPSDGGTGWFAAYDYGTGIDKRRLTPEEVFHSWIPSQDDFRQAESPLQAARIPIDLIGLIDRYDHAFIKNDAVPATMVTHQRIDERDDRQAWREQFLNQNRGPDRAGGTIFNEVDPDSDGKVVGTIAIERLGLSQRDAQFAERYASSIKATLVGIGVPMSRLMDASASTFSNSGQEWINYWQSTIKTAAQDLSDDVNTQLAPRLGNAVGWFDMSGIAGIKVKEDKNYSDVGLPDLLKAGIVSQAWAAEQIGAPSDGLDDMPLSPLTQLHLASGLNADGSPRITGTVGRGAVYFNDREDMIARTSDDDVTRNDLEERSGSLDGLDEYYAERRLRETKVIDRRVQVLEGQWLRAFDNLFSRQEASVVAKLESARGRKCLASFRAGEPDANQVFDQENWTAETRTTMAGLYQDVGGSAAVKLVDQLVPDSGIDLTPTLTKVHEVLDKRANNLSGPITEKTFHDIKGAIHEGVAAGEGIQEIAQRVRKVFVGYRESRSVLIARTETIGAFNIATVEAAKTLPDIAAGKEWLATNDKRTRPEHHAADGQVRLLTQPFSVGGAELEAPSEPNCRCSVLILDPTETQARLG